MKSPKEQKLQHSRRRFLQLAGASALTLPFLRAFPGYAQTEAPRFLVLTLKGNGIVRHTFGANKLGEGRGQIEFRPTLASLAGLEEYVTPVTGLFGKAADDIGGTHEGGMLSVWTGRAARGSGASIDQIIAANATGTPRRSLEFRAISPNEEPSKNDNNRMIFDAAGTPLDPREDAISAFDQLFAGVTSSSTTVQGEDPNVTRRELLFAHVDQQLSELAPRLASEDRLHLDALRGGWTDLHSSLTQPVEVLVQCDPQNPSSLNGRDLFQRNARQMTEVLVMAFACGITRIGSLQWSQGRTDYQDHHNISHSQPQAPEFVYYDRWDPVLGDIIANELDNPSAQKRAQYDGIWEQLNSLDRVYMEEFAHLLRRLQAFPASGGGTLLDQALVTFCTEIDNGNGHDHDNMPYLLAGGAGGRLNRGTVVNYPTRNHMNPTPAGLRYHNDFLTTIAHLMGRTDINSVGASQYNQGPLRELIL